MLTQGGEDVTEAYVRGAQIALTAAREAGAGEAILKARSPSCGKGCIYDGTFSRNEKSGDGVTAALLEREGIRVRTEEEL